MPISNENNVIQYGHSFLSPEKTQEVYSLLQDFDEVVEGISQTYFRSVIRARLPNKATVWVSSKNVTVVAEPADVVGTLTMLELIEEPFPTTEEIARFAIGTFDLQDPYVIEFDASLLTLAKEDPERRQSLNTQAHSYVQAELKRFEDRTLKVSISPLFGHYEYQVQHSLCFILMPFSDPLTSVYSHIVKPVVESHGLVARRADDVRGVETIMHDIWKSICEARIIIADLTGRNPNVFYELGIAHTVGKQTILISQEDDNPIPFDVSHRRQIRYQDNAAGLARLRSELDATITSVLTPTGITVDI